MHVVRHDAVVVDAVPRLQPVHVLAVGDLDLPGQHVDELLPLVGGGVHALRGAGVDVDEERLHVPAGLVRGQGEEVQVAARRAVPAGEAHHRLVLAHAGDHGPDVLLVVQEGAQAHAQRRARSGSGGSGRG